jgi:hypothetical protein
MGEIGLALFNKEDLADIIKHIDEAIAIYKYLDHKKETKVKAVRLLI